MDGSDYQILEFLAIRLSPEVDKSSFQDEDTEQQIYISLWKILIGYSQPPHQNI